jgi:beta-1,4-mannosyltransferase
MIKVIFIPDYRGGNYYQKALADSLSNEGVTVSFGITSYLFSALRSIKNNWKPDFLHIHWQHPFLLANSRVKTILKSSSFIGELVILKLFGIKIVWTVHNIVSHEGEFSSLELFFSKILAKLCNKIIVHCQSAKKEVMNIYGARESLIVVMAHGNYIQSYENGIDKEQARKQLHYSAEDIIFLYFGLIEPYKGVPELIEAFKKLNSLQAKLLIAGQPLNNEIAEEIRERCSGNKNIKLVLKFIPDNDIQIYMNAADFIVLPYKDILTSGSVILAMSFGKPVIAPAIGCIPDVLDNKGNFLYNPPEKDGLLEAMKHALNADLKKMGAHNFELAKELRWDDIARRTCEIYRECLKRKR